MAHKTKRTIYLELLINQHFYDDLLFLATKKHSDFLIPEKRYKVSFKNPLAIYNKTVYDWLFNDLDAGTSIRYADFETNLNVRTAFHALDLETLEKLAIVYKDEFISYFRKINSYDYHKINDKKYVIYAKLQIDIMLNTKGLNVVNRLHYEQTRNGIEIDDDIITSNKIKLGGIFYPRKSDFANFTCKPNTPMYLKYKYYKYCPITEISCTDFYSLYLQFKKSDNDKGEDFDEAKQLLSNIMGKHYIIFNNDFIKNYCGYHNNFNDIMIPLIDPKLRHYHISICDVETCIFKSSGRRMTKSAAKR
jgi:hypothetical protein